MSESVVESVEKFLHPDYNGAVSLPLVESGEYNVVVKLTKSHRTVEVLAILQHGSRKIDTYSGAIPVNPLQALSADDKVAYLKSQISSRTEYCKIASWLVDWAKIGLSSYNEECMAKTDLFVQVANLAERYNPWAFKNQIEHVAKYLVNVFPIKAAVSAQDVAIIYKLGSLESKFEVLPISDYEEIGGVSIEIGNTAFVFELQQDGSYIRYNKSSDVYKRSQLMKQLKR